jgi:hypothetical protein
MQASPQKSQKEDRAIHSLIDTPDGDVCHRQTWAQNAVTARVNSGSWSRFLVVLQGCKTKQGTRIALGVLHQERFSSSKYCFPTQLIFDKN